MRYFYFLLSLLTISVSLQSMKHTLDISSCIDNQEYNIVPIDPNVLDEIYLKIFSHITPVATWNQDPDQIGESLNEIAKDTYTLKQTCRKLEIIFNENNINQLMDINDENKNILLIYAAKQGIPQFIKYAINKKADINYIHEYATPLIWSSVYKNYKCCSLLLNHGANAKIPSEMTSLTSKYLAIKEDDTNAPTQLYPIEIAILQKHKSLKNLLRKYSDKSCTLNLKKDKSNKLFLLMHLSNEKDIDVMEL